MSCPIMRRKRSSVRMWAIASAVVILVPPLARADAISFTLADTSLETASGGTVTFDGTVTNNTGVDLRATDFFFNFFGFDFTSVTSLQDLGVGTDFAIPNGSTSVLIPLFDVTLGAVPAGASFPIEVQLEDAAGDLSAIQTATVSVPGVQAVPEPPLFWLLPGASAGAALARRRVLRAR